MKNSNYGILLATLLVLLFVGCQKNGNQSKSNGDEENYQILNHKGFDTTGIVKLGNYYLVEGDILIDRTALELTEKRQAINSNSQVVLSNRASTITVRIDDGMPTDGGALDWRNEVIQAINDYNSLNTGLSFSFTSGSAADITVRVGMFDPTYNLEMPGNVIAAAGLPSNGNPFNTIVINSMYVVNIPTTGQKRYNIVHELGHCIGFRHTNWYNLNNEKNDLVLGVGSSPNSNYSQDQESVFNGNTALNSWNGFSLWDQYAILFLYPTSPVMYASLQKTNGGSLASDGQMSLLFGPNGINYASGTIRARAGTSVNVKLSLNKYPPTSSANSQLYFTLSGANLTGPMGNNATVTNTQYPPQTFIMPVSGFVNFSCSFTSYGGNANDVIIGSLGVY